MFMPTTLSYKMRIIDRYLLGRYIVPFLYCLAAFLLVMLIYDFSINLEDFIAGKVRLDILLEYFVNSLPMKIVEVIPMASLLSVIYSIGQLKRHNEITAMQASGISPLRLMVPFLGVGLCLSALVLIVNDTLVPRCAARVARLEAVYMKKGVANKTSVFAFYNLAQRRSWVGVLDSSKKKLQRIEIREFDDQDRVRKKITGELAQHTQTGWKITDGKITEYDGIPTRAERVRSFHEEIFPFAETLNDLLDSQKDPQFMRRKELKTHMNTHPKHSRIYHEEKVAYYHKWAYPFLNLLVLLMGVPIGLTSEKGYFLVGMGRCLGLFVAYYGINLISLPLGKNEVIPPWLGAWLPNIVFGFIGLELVRRMK